MHGTGPTSVIVNINSSPTLTFPKAYDTYFRTTLKKKVTTSSKISKPASLIRVFLLVLAFCFLGKPNGNCNITHIEHPLTFQLAHDVKDHDVVLVDAKKHNLTSGISHARKRHHLTRRRKSLSSFVSDNYIASDGYTNKITFVTNEPTTQLYSFSSFIRPTYYVHLFRCALF